MYSYLDGLLLLLRVALAQLPLLLHLPGWLTNPALLEHRLAPLRAGTVPSLTLSLPSGPAASYNSALKQAGAGLRALHPQQPDSLPLLLHLVRLATLAAASTGSLPLTLGIAAFQFLLAPYSLFVSLTAAIGFLHYILLPHYLIHAGLLLLASSLPHLPAMDWLAGWGRLPINPATIALFLLVDQALCLYSSYRPGAARYPAAKMLRHAFHGFINSKTSVVVILLLCYHHHPQLSLWLWALEGFLLQATPRLSALLSSSTLHFSAVFYHQHRMAHLPVVYPQAHKLHHYPGAWITAFDASLYGCGMPEEYFLLGVEVLLLAAGLPPASLGWYVLNTNGLGNKHGHTITEGVQRQENFHTDHHLTHTKNYGFGSFNCLLDLYFQTAARELGHRVLPYQLSASGAPGGEVEVTAKVDSDTGLTSFVFTTPEKEEQSCY